MITLWIFIKENLRRDSKESIAIIKPRKNKRGNEKLGDVWRSCTRDNVEAGESYFVLNPAADRQPMEIRE